MSELSQHSIWNMAMIIADDGPPRARLGRIGVYLNPRAATLDNPEIKAKLHEFLSRLSHTEAGPDDDNSIHATVKRLEEKEARHLAHEIIGKPFSRR
jgi:hypothetical protein